MNVAAPDGRASAPPPSSPLAYAQDAGNDEWNEAAPAASWKAYRMDAAEVFMPFLCDVALHVGGFVFYAHVTKLATGANGSVFLGNIIALKRQQLAEKRAKGEGGGSDSGDAGGGNADWPFMVHLDLSNLIHMPAAAKIFSSVLEFAYSGSVDLTDENVAPVLVASFLLRIRPLFAACKRKMYELFLESRGQAAVIASAEHVLSCIKALTPTEDTGELIHAMINMAHKAVKAHARTKSQAIKPPTVSKQVAKKKMTRRRSSYMAAMHTVHQRHINTMARLKPLPPGQGVGAPPAESELFTEQLLEKGGGGGSSFRSSAAVENVFAGAGGAGAAGDDGASNDKQGATDLDHKMFDVEHSIAEIVVGADETPGKSVTRNLHGRRFSYTVPRGARTGDVLKVQIPKAALASPIKFRSTSNTPHRSDPPMKADDPPAQVQADPAAKKVDAWLYKDADGVIFGPFEGSLMASWFRETMIPGNLLVRPADQEDMAFQEIDTLFAGRTQEAFC